MDGRHDLLPLKVPSSSRGPTCATTTRPSWASWFQGRSVPPGAHPDKAREKNETNGQGAVQEFVPRIFRTPERHELGVFFEYDLAQSLEFFGGHEWRRRELHPGPEMCPAGTSTCLAGLSRLPADQPGYRRPVGYHHLSSSFRRSQPLTMELILAVLNKFHSVTASGGESESTVVSAN